MKDALSRIYFDDLPVKLLGDESRPPLDRIVRAGGKVPGHVDVLVLESPQDKKGHVLAPGEIIDRTVEPAKPIYLRSVPKPHPLEPLAAPVDPVVLTSRAPPTTPAAGADPGSPVAPMAPLDDVDPVISQLGVDPAERLAALRLRRAEDQAAAEAEAEERKEEDREQESALQDEDDDLRDSLEDKDS